MGYERPDLSGRVAFITGTTRGVGKAIALALADCGCAVVSTGKTSEADGADGYGGDRDLEGTIERTAREVRDRGADALAVRLDVRDAASVRSAVDRAVEAFGRIDVCVNNAGAIQLAPVADMPADRFDLMTEVNVRGAYVTTRAALPHLRETGGHVVFNSPPNVRPAAPGKAAYAWSKQGMTFLAKSLAGELDGVAANAVWPVTALDTRATRHFGLGSEDDWRTPDVLADALLELVSRDPAVCTGNVFYDEDLLRDAGVTDFSPYNLTEGDPAPISARMFDPDYDRPD